MYRSYCIIHVHNTGCVSAYTQCILTYTTEVKHSQQKLLIVDGIHSLLLSRGLDMFVSEQRVWMETHLHKRVTQSYTTIPVSIGTHTYSTCIYMCT